MFQYKKTYTLYVLNIITINNMTNIKLIKGKYKGYEVCFAKKGQIFPRDGYYLTNGSNVIYLEDAMEEIREETIREERLRASKIVEDMMEDSEYWQPIANKIITGNILNKLKI